MADLRIRCVGLLLLTFCSLGLAQSTPADANSGIASQPAAQSAEPATDPDAGPDAGAARTHRRAHPAPCWRQAGLTADMVNQRWKLEDQKKTRIAAVCGARVEGVGTAVVGERRHMATNGGSFLDPLHRRSWAVVCLNRAEALARGRVGDGEAVTSSKAGLPGAMP